VLNNVATLVAEGFLFLALIATFVSVNWVATLGLIIYFGLIAFAMHYLIGSKSQRASEVISAKTMEANKYLGDVLSAFRELAVLGKREMYFDQIYSARKATALSVGDQMYLAGMPRYIVETALLLGVFIFGLFQSQSNDLVATATTLGIFLTGGLRIVAAMLPLQNAAVSLKETLSPARAALDVLDLEVVGAEPWSRKSSQDSTVAVSIELDKVTVEYPGSDCVALGPMSLRVAPGSQVAIIGASGAGKSTLADVIVGLLPTSSGRANLQGSLAEEFIAVHPGSVAYVPQEPGRLSGTIAQNVAVGVKEEDVDLQALEDALTAAHLQELIGSLPDGVNTDLGKQGDSLSGGQLQRIGLARALYSKPGLLVMDEATSSLDAITEHEIGLALEQLRGKTTVILIAHRLNTVKNADEVIFLEQGLVKDRGPFRELQKRLPEVALAASLMSTT
jgi:ABC-type multidrug transport system fused ATPase/permease subunit